ncbi:MAG: aminotransferase class V-fold PLP-dependent enzyme [Planctomycetales bacterium]|nr:aminotransferase class V-fold PLP-dependent enzyme [Planctomycetales bacterium]
MMSHRSLESARRLEAQAIQSRLIALAESGAWRSYEGEQLATLRERLQEVFARPLVHCVSSGTVAVEIALRAVGVQAEDEVVLAGYDFPGNFRAIEAIGARPVLTDLSAGAWTVGEEQVITALTPKTKAVLVSHLHGSIAPLDSLEPSLRERGVALIEDACQVPGGSLAGRPLGSFGDVSVLSFGGSKLLSAGRGGAVLTSDPRLAQRITILNDRGNLAYPMSELQAAVLIPQLDHLADRHDARASAVDQLRSQLATSPIAELLFGERASQQATSPAWYKLPITAPDQATRDTWLAFFGSAQVSAGEPFRGFWKRSARRCAISMPLTECQRASERTLLVAHDCLEDQAELEKVIRVLETLR